MQQVLMHIDYYGVAPPRGERGLKLRCFFPSAPKGVVAPPRGERGLKYFPAYAGESTIQSLPLVGSVD